MSAEIDLAATAHLLADRLERWAGRLDMVEQANEVALLFDAAAHLVRAVERFEAAEATITRVKKLPVEEIQRGAARVWIPFVRKREIEGALKGES